MNNRHACCESYGLPFNRSTAHAMPGKGGLRVHDLLRITWETSLDVVELSVTRKSDFHKYLSEHVFNLNLSLIFCTSTENKRIINSLLICTHKETNKT